MSEGTKEIDLHWMDREQAAIDNGAYQTVPWVAEKWHDTTTCGCCHYYAFPLHFVHMHPAMDGTVRYTKDEEHGKRSRYTITKPGRYLTEYFSNVLSVSDIEKWAAACKAHMVQLKFAKTPDEIEDIYTRCYGVIQSCMVYPKSHWAQYGVPCQPTRIYGAGDLAVAYLEKGNPPRPLARVLTWPEKKLYGRRYGDHALIEKVLQGNGYKYGGDYGPFAGAKVLKIPADRKGGARERVVCTSIDLGHTLKDLPGSDEFLQLCASNDPGANYGPVGASGYIERYVKCTKCNQCTSTLHRVYPDADGKVVQLCEGCLVKATKAKAIIRCHFCTTYWDTTVEMGPTSHFNYIVNATTGVVDAIACCAPCAAARDYVRTKARTWVHVKYAIQCKTCKAYYMPGVMQCCDTSPVYWKAFDHDGRCTLWASKVAPKYDYIAKRWEGVVANMQLMPHLNCTGDGILDYIGPVAEWNAIAKLNGITVLKDAPITQMIVHWLTWDGDGNCYTWFGPDRPQLKRGANGWNWPAHGTQHHYPEQLYNQQGAHKQFVKYVGPLGNVPEDGVLEEQR